MSDSTSFIILGDFTQTKVTMTEVDTNSDGIIDAIRFDVEVVPVGSEDVIGDLRYLNLSVDESLLAGLSFESLDGGDSHNFRKSANGIDDIPGMATGFDIGIEFGDDGLKGGNDDIQTASFLIKSTGEIDLSDFLEFAIRLTSVGPEEGDRNGSDHGDTVLQADIEIVKTTEGLDDQCPEIIVGETVNWQYAVTNTGTTALTNVVVMDDAGTPLDITDDFAATAVLGMDAVHNVGDLNVNGILDVGETWQFSAQGTATDGEYENIATVEGDYTAGQVSGSVSDSEDDCYEGVTPAISIVKKTNGTDDVCPQILVGETVTWTYTVTNTGEVDELANVVVVDDNGTPLDTTDDFLPTLMSGDADSDGLLDFGETWIFSHSGTAADGDYANVGTVTGDATDEVGNTVEVEDEEDDCYEGVTPDITIVKKTNGTDDVCPQVLVGSTVTWTYTVTNTGDVQGLSGIVVVDDNGTAATGDDFMPTFTGGDTNNNNLLDFGEIWTYSATGTAIAGEYENVATVNGTATDDLQNTAQVTDSEEDCYEGVEPDISILKKTNGTDDVCPQIIVGETVTWTYEVRNEGDVAELTNVSVVDDNGTPLDSTDDFAPTFTGGDTDSDGRLDVGEVWTYSASSVAVEGEYENIATTEADYAIGQTTGSVTDSEDDCYEGVVPDIAIVKKTNGTNDVCPQLLVGSVVTWTYEVQNTGDVDNLANVAVMDDAGTPMDATDDFAATFVSGDTDNDGLLDFNETWIFSASGTVQDGEYENVATVTGDATDEVSNTVEVTDSEDDCYEGLTPDINIVKTTNGSDDTCPIVDVGSTVTWGYTVTNTGEVDELSNIVVIDDNGTADTGDDFMPMFTGGDTDSDGLLDFGEVWTYSATGTAMAGAYENVATVTGTASDEFQNTSQVTDNEDDCYFGAQGPGVRTPGFWQSPNGLQFWDGIEGNESKAGQPGFADGELLYDIVGRGTGMLIGDFNQNGVEDAGEDTLFIAIGQALKLIGNEKPPHDARWILGRDMVASWLNFLADNPIGDEDDVGSPAYYIDAGVDWMLEFADGNNDGKFDLLDPGVRASSAAWQTGVGDIIAGKVIHNALNSYNNNGTIDGMAFANDADSAMFISAMQVLSAGGTDLYMV